MRTLLITGLAVLCMYSAAANPEHSSPTEEENSLIASLNKQLDSIDKKLIFKKGHVSLADGHIELTVPEGFLFIDAEQARFILEEGWGNMPDMDVAGMLVRKGFRATNLENDHSFVISYGAFGHVDDNKNTELDHDALLSVLQHNMERSNEMRTEAGYNTLQVTGWVMVPYYDNFKKALYWASRVKVNGSDEEILNYNLRLLGNTGVIKINAVATMDQLSAIKNALPAIIAQTKFAKGDTYADYREGTHAKSDWLLTDMVAGEKKPNILVATFKWAGIFLLAGAMSTAYFKYSKRKLEKAVA
ncbi:MAG TPA: DUF2167 domain-containing protein [Flavihumibacter sp.]|nr:DUF2167 domain-containing protein [Flavihumibacter sp.]